MKCPACVTANQRSTITADGYQRTSNLAYNAYYDEDGVYHSHDPNRSYENFRCSKGHFLRVSTPHACPAAGCKVGHENAVISVRQP